MRKMYLNEINTIFLQFYSLVRNFLLGILGNVPLWGEKFTLEKNESASKCPFFINHCVLRAKLELFHNLL